VTYGIWRADAPANVAVFDREEAALAAVRAAVEQHGPAFVAEWALVTIPEDDTADWQTVAEGAQLARRAARAHPTTGARSPRR
jgi:hypothetical protein